MKIFAVAAATVAFILANAGIGLCQKTTEIPWAGGNFSDVMKEAKDRNVPILIYSGNET